MLFTRLVRGGGQARIGDVSKFHRIFMVPNDLSYE